MMANPVAFNGGGVVILVARDGGSALMGLRVSGAA